MASSPGRGARPYQFLSAPKPSTASGRRRRRRPFDQLHTSSAYRGYRCAPRRRMSVNYAFAAPQTPSVAAAECDPLLYQNHMLLPLITAVSRKLILVEDIDM